MAVNSIGSIPLNLTLHIVPESSSLKSPGPWYSFQQALEVTADLPYSATLWEAGCRSESGWDCHSACMDPVVGPTMLWTSQASLYTLANCISYPYIAYALANGHVSAHYETDSDASSNSAGSSAVSTEDFASLVEKYNIHPNGSHGLIGSTDGWLNIDRCTVADCDARSDDQSCEPASSPGSRIFYDANGDAYEVPLPHFNTSICTNAPKTLNTDVGGVGVISSFIMQVTILLAAYLAVALAEGTWIRCATYLVMLCRSKVQPAPGEAAGEAHQKGLARSKQMQQQCSFPRHFEVLLATLADFHKTQVFFMLAMQVASLVALYNAAYISATTWQQLWNNISYFRTIGWMGIDPILLNLWLLQKARKASCYVIMASVCCISVSMVTLIKTAYIDVEPDMMITSELELPECGGLASPTLYCLEPGGATQYKDIDFMGPSFARETIWNVSLAAAGLAALLLYPLVAKIPRRTRTTRTIKRLFVVYYLCIEAWLLSCNVMDLQGYIHYLAFTERKVWSLGQIIAVSVWVPVVLEYFYQSLPDIKIGSGWKLIWPIRVVKDDEIGLSHTSPMSPRITQGGQGAAEPSNDGGSASGQALSCSHELSLMSLKAPHQLAHASKWAP